MQSISDLTATDPATVATQPRGIFGTICHYITSGTERVGDVGDHLITSAQKDLTNLRALLVSTWEMPAQERDTVALYLAGVLSRIGHSVFLLVTTIVASIVKLSVGSACMVVGFRVFTLLSRLANTFWEVLKQGCEVVGDLIKRLANNFCDMIMTAVRRVCDICARIAASVARNLIWLGEKFKDCGKFIYNRIVDVCNAIQDAVRGFCKHFAKLLECFIDVIDNLSRSVAHTLAAIMSVVCGGVNAGIIIMCTIGMAIGALFIETGMSNVIAGVAKFFFMLDEGIAVTIGIALDGLCDGAKGLGTAIKALFGVRPQPTVIEEFPNHQPLLEEHSFIGNRELNADHEPDIEQRSLTSASIPIEAPQGPGLLFVAPETVRSTYCRISLHEQARYLNSSIAWTGTEIEKSYKRNRDELFGVRAWSSEHSGDENHQSQRMTLPL